MALRVREPGKRGTFVPLVADETPAGVAAAAAATSGEATATAGSTAGGTAAAVDTAPAPDSRTRQMPVPATPDEPLRLLAELTNTPPPPPTPLRTTLRRVKIWTPLVVLVLLVLAGAQLLRPLPTPELTLTAASAYTFPGAKPTMPWPSEGQTVVEVEGLGSLGQHGTVKPQSIASVAKVMTAYLVLHDHPIKPGTKGATIKVDQQAEDDYNTGRKDNESIAKVTAGQKISEYEALEDVLLPSANNVARLLARWDGGTQAAFVKRMNATARRLGMTQTTYTDPSGLTPSTKSTAPDQLKLAQVAMRDATFAKIVDTISYKDSNGDTQRNFNSLAGYNGVVGIKTGTSTAAGGNLMFAATRTVAGQRRLVIGVMLGQYTPPIITSVTTRSEQVIKAAQHVLTSHRVVHKGDVLGYVDDGLGGRVPVVATKDATAVGWSGLTVHMTLSPRASGLPHAAPAGTVVGTLLVGNGTATTKIPVALAKPLAKPSIGTRLTRLG
jgi:D-alanyl-D-alanine carboxypeptidase